MPIIPTLQSSQILNPSSPVEIASTRDARLEGETMQTIGNAANKLASTWRAVSNEVEQTKLRTEAELEMDELHTQIKLSGKPDGSDYEEMYSKGADRIFQSKIKDVWDPQLRLSLEKDFEIQKANGQLRTREEAFNSFQSHTTDGAKEIIGMMGRQAMNNPDTADAILQDFRGGFIKNLEGKLSPKLLEQYYDLARQSAIKGRIDGLINSKRFGEAFNDLNATEQESTIKLTADQMGSLGLKADGDTYLPMVDRKGAALTAPRSELLRGLTPDQRDAFLDQIKRASEVATHTKMRVVNDNVSAYVQFRLQGKEVSASEAAAVRGMVSGLPADIRGQYQAKIAQADKVGPIIRKAMTGSRDDVAKALKSLDEIGSKPGDLAARAEAEELKRHALTAIAQIQKNDLEDPVAFGLQSNQDAATLKRAAQADPKMTPQFVQKSLADQSYRGIPMHLQRVMTNGEATANGERILAAQMTDPSLLANEIDRLDQTYGQYFPQAMKEIVKENKGIDPGIGVAAIMHNPNSKREVLTNVIQRKQIAQLFEKVEPEQKKYLKNDLESNKAAFMGALRANLKSADGLETLKTFEEQVEIQAQKNMVMKNMKPADAARNAYETVIGSNFEVVRGTNIIMPRRAAYNSEFVARFVEDFKPSRSSVETKFDFSPGANGGMPERKAREIRVNRWADDLGIAPPESMYAQNPGMPKDQVRANYQDRVGQSGKWVTNPDQSGVRLVYDNGVRQIPVVRANGSPVEFSFYELGNYVDKKTFSGLRK